MGSRVSLLGRNGRKIFTILVLLQLCVGLSIFVTSCKPPFWQEAELQTRLGTNSQANLNIAEGKARMKISAYTHTGMYISLRLRFEVTFRDDSQLFSFRPGLIEVSLQGNSLEPESVPLNELEWSIIPGPSVATFVLPTHEGSEWHIYSGSRPESIPYNDKSEREPWRITIGLREFVLFNNLPVNLDTITVLGY